MANQWLRLWHDMPTDPKWRTIARVSAQPIALVQAVYVHLIVDASRHVTRGHVTVTQEDLASALDVTEEQIGAVLSAMQGRVLDGEMVSGWAARQPKKEDQGDDQTGAMSNTERKRLQRQRQREEAELKAGHGESREVTPDKDKDKEEDKDKSKDQKPLLDADPEPDLFERFWTLYPKKVGKKDAGKAFTKLKVTQPLFDSMAKALAVLVVSPDWTKDRGSFVPNPATWLNGERWKDELPSNVHAHPTLDRHNDFDKKNYHDGLILREDGSYGI